MFIGWGRVFAQVQLGSDIDGEATGDRSGTSVSMNSAGDRVAIGAPYNDGTIIAFLLWKLNYLKGKRNSCNNLSQ